MASSGARDQRSSYGRQAWLALGYFALVTVVILFPLVLTADGWVKDPGDPILNAWILSWDVHALTGPAGLFSAPIFHPYPLTLAYSESLLGNLPFAMPVLLLTGNGILASNLLILAGYILSGWCMYLLVRGWTGNHGAGLLAGSIYAFCPYHLAHLSHLQMVTIQWLPLVMLFLDRLLRHGRWRDALWLALFLTWQTLCSYYIGLFTAVMLALLVAGYCVAGLARPTWRVAGQLMVVAALTVAVNLPLALPYFTVSKALSVTRQLPEIVSYSAHAWSLLTPAPDHALYGTLTRAAGSPGNVESRMFMGTLVWVLALLGCVATPRGSTARRYALVFGVVALILLVLSLGPQAGNGLPLPYALLYRFVPGFRGIRAVARLGLLAAAALAVPAAYGLVALHTRWPRLSATTTAAACLWVVLDGGVLFPAGVIVPTAAPAYVPSLTMMGPRPATVLALPIPEAPLPRAFAEARRIYEGTHHWQPLVNGYSGLAPPLYSALVRDTLRFPDEASLGWLDLLRVDRVVLEADAYPAPADYDDARGRLAQYPDRLTVISDDGAQVVAAVGLPQWETEGTSQFGAGLELVGYQVEHSGGGLRLRLCWKPLRDGLAATSTDVWLLGGDGPRRLWREPTASGGRSVTAWRFGEVLVEELVAPLPRSWPGHALGLSLFDETTQQALPVTDGAAGPTGRTVLSLGALTDQGVARLEATRR